MKNKRLFLISSITIMFFISIFAYVYLSTNVIDKNDTVLKEVNSIGKSGESKIPFVVYIPSSKTNLLDPMVVEISSKGDTYKNIFKSILSNSNGYFNGDYKLVMAKRNNSILTLKFSNGFKEELSQDENKRNLEIMSIVNTFSEITSTEHVEIYSGNELLNIKEVNKLSRDTKLINVDKFNSPEDVLRTQMKHEQNGDFLKAYLLMSYKHSPNKKMYYDYIKEMEEIKSLGFLSGDFKIKDCKINEDKATLKVEFINVSATGDPVNTSIVEVKCIKLNGMWFVDWI